MAADSKLAEFLDSPPEVQAAFMRQVQDATEAQTESEQFLDGLEVDGPAPEQPERPWREMPSWDGSWSARALRATQPQAENLDIEALMEVAAVRYVPVLTGDDREWIACPLPDHEERTPSFHAKPEPDPRWRCFGCNRSGSIYDLAGALWGIEPKGSGFIELHGRLREMFA